MLFRSFDRKSLFIQLNLIPDYFLGFANSGIRQLERSNLKVNLDFRKQIAVGSDAHHDVDTSEFLECGFEERSLVVVIKDIAGSPDSGAV